MYVGSPWKQNTTLLGLSQIPLHTKLKRINFLLTFHLLEKSAITELWSNIIFQLSSMWLIKNTEEMPGGWRRALYDHIQYSDVDYCTGARITLRQC